MMGDLQFGHAAADPRRQHRQESVHLPVQVDVLDDLARYAFSVQPKSWSGTPLTALVKKFAVWDGSSRVSHGSCRCRRHPDTTSYPCESRSTRRGMSTLRSSCAILLRRTSRVNSSHLMGEARRRALTA